MKKIPLMKAKMYILIAVLLVVACLLQSAQAWPMGTAFTYQGRLVDANDFADGFYEFQFELYDSAINGTQINGTYALRDVEVVDGYFTVEVDFGTGAFTGDARWLETSIRPINTTQSFTILSPRQELTPSPYALYAQNAGVDSDWQISGNDMFSVPTGNVGIGTSTPEAKMGIASASSGATLGIGRASGQPSITSRSDAHGGWLIMDSTGSGNAGVNYYDNGDVYLAYGGGNVSVGVASPSQRLQVAGQIYSSSGGFRFPDNSVQTTAATTSATYWESSGDSIRNTNAANVGIGVTIPTSKLTVGGDIFVSTANSRVITPVLEIYGGSDLSEQFDIQSDVQGCVPSAGMVVSIDPANPGKLIISSQAYDRKVAGIISGAGGIQPGMLMGQKNSEASGASPVALTGRVYCLADTSGGVIQPGDLLTTSQTPGHAMKVTDYNRAQGAILGKAMTALENGKGQVLVLVTLQ